MLRLCLKVRRRGALNLRRVLVMSLFVNVALPFTCSSPDGSRVHRSVALAHDHDVLLLLLIVLSVHTHICSSSPLARLSTFTLRTTGYCTP